MLLTRRTSNAAAAGSDEPATAAPATTTRRRVRDLRHLAALAAWCGCVVYAVRVQTPADGMVLTGLMTAAVLLTLPEIFRRAQRLLSEHEQTLPPTYAARLFDARQAGATERQLQNIVAQGLGKQYFRDGGRRADGLEVELQDIDYLDIDLP